MSEQPPALDQALELVIAAAREHLAAVRAAGGALDDQRVWRSYVALNNSSFDYDQLLLNECGEVTPWDTEQIDTSGSASLLTEPNLRLGGRPDDPYPQVISVRQRRDFRVPSVAALLRAAGAPAAEVASATPAAVGEAVLALVREGDGSLTGLDVPELEPQGGVVSVAAVAQPVRWSGGVASEQVFRVEAAEQELARLDEQPDSPVAPRPPVDGQRG